MRAVFMPRSRKNKMTKDRFNNRKEGVSYTFLWFLFPKYVSWPCSYFLTLYPNRNFCYERRLLVIICIVFCIFSGVFISLNVSYKRSTLLITVF